MKAHELRVENWVKGDIGIPYQIELSDFADWYYDHNSHEFGNHIHPVPLTEEWFVKFGAKKHSSGISVWYSLDFFDEVNQYNKPYIYFKPGNDYAELIDAEYDDRIMVIEYVHQLQNVIFALTGNEIELRKM